MYLKNVEMVGFKSFADRTKLEFEPGMMAIVGPNGCGKSNVSDAIRWVLGEQSAKALRGAAMTDCIFSGTDQRKPVGMAEVSLTLGDCEKALGTEYNEVTVTRRVLGSGEGQYFINKTLCRLKDIQRLFMDTGIGTDAYSTMEQGRIDQILSSRPEDRRAVFEEASGITKFKADKREALRKLDHTEANLLRLADIIKEVKRQIISLQRQAGKARRYKELHERLRRVDLHATRGRLASLEESIRIYESRLASLGEQDEALRHDLEETQTRVRDGRGEIAELEQKIARAMEASLQAKTELGRLHEMISVNRDRIQELESLALRDTKDADEAQARIDEHRRARAGVEAEHAEAARQRAAAQLELDSRSEELRRLERQARELSETQDRLRGEALDLESRLAHLQNELNNLENQERGEIIRRERLAAEHSELRRVVLGFDERQSRMDGQLAGLRDAAAARDTALRALLDRRTERQAALTTSQAQLSDLKAEAAARKAQIELLREGQKQREGFPGGARWLLQPLPDAPFDASHVLGTLAEQTIAEPPYQAALEAALRAWLDAVLVPDHAAALELLKALEAARKGPARLVAVQSGSGPAEPPAGGPGEELMPHVQCSEHARPVVARMLRGVRVVESLADIAFPLPPDIVVVTKSGAVIRSDGSAEHWTPDAYDGNPVARQHTLLQWEREAVEQATRIEQQQRAVRDAQEQLATVESEIAQGQAALEESRRDLALREGECHVVMEEAQQARQRNETVTWELEALTDQHSSGHERRAALSGEMEQSRNRQADVRARLATINDQHRAAEAERAESLAGVAEQRVQVGEHGQATDALARRMEALEARMADLEKLSGERRRGVDAYQARIIDVGRMLEDAAGRVEPLQRQVADCEQQLAEARATRDAKTAHVATLEDELRRKRDVMDEVRTRKSQQEVQVAEERMRRQNLLERVTSEYRISPEQIQSEPLPEWGDEGEPDREAMETMIAEIRAKLESMGAVNLVAIEEHQEFETRHAFLTQEFDDLQNAKQQLLDMIRKINRTTTELFSETFRKVNENFQETFKRLFGGGSAKLVLLDEEDVLESGIEIIARPPGKKLQTVSLLSGGERTMTAVALLFALYMVKPSPFCLLDELDAALDDANIGRFVQMLQGFLTHSQFIVITHNRQTIAAADVLYGITMESGVSGIMSVKFSHHERQEARTDNASGHGRFASALAPED